MNFDDLVRELPPPPNRRGDALQDGFVDRLRFGCKQDSIGQAIVWRTPALPLRRRQPPPKSALNYCHFLYFREYVQRTRNSTHRYPAKLPASPDRNRDASVETHPIGVCSLVFEQVLHFQILVRRRWGPHNLNGFSFAIVSRASYQAQILLAELRFRCRRCCGLPTWEREFRALSFHETIL